MKRRVLIIGSPLEEGHPAHLRGVKEDVDNYSKLLLSANGGAYNHSEIIILNAPSVREVSRAIYFQRNADFAITIFSGHGFMCRGENYVCINKYDNIAYTNLFSDSFRNVVLMDACRSDYPYDHCVGISGLDLQFDQEHKNLAKQIYNSVIAQVPNGRVVIFSASEGQSAIDTDKGGAFSVKMFSETVNWVNSNSAMYLSIGTVFNRSQYKLNHKEQLPQLYYSNSNMQALPFAINANTFLKSTKNNLIRNKFEEATNKKKTAIVSITGWNDRPNIR